MTSSDAHLEDVIELGTIILNLRQGPWIIAAFLSWKYVTSGDYSNPRQVNHLDLPVLDHDPRRCAARTHKLAVRGTIYAATA